MTRQAEKGTTTTQRIENLESGQKLIIYAILITFLSVGIQAAYGDIGGLIIIPAMVISIVGMFRLASGLGYSVCAKIGLAILLVIPLISLITMLVLNSHATKALRGAGYKVGLLGARR